MSCTSEIPPSDGGVFHVIQLLLCRFHRRYAHGVEEAQRHLRVRNLPLGVLGLVGGHGIGSLAAHSGKR